MDRRCRGRQRRVDGYVLQICIATLSAKLVPLSALADRLLLINDLINNVLDRYQAIKAGDWAKAREIDAT
jgi:hypothetical protein